MKDDFIYIDKFKLWVDNNNFLRAVQNKNTDFELDDAKNIMAMLKKMSNGKARPFLLDIRGVLKASLAARKYVTGGDAKTSVIALAIIVDSPISKIIANIFINFNNPPYPVRLFSSESKAIKWLKNYE